MRKVQQVILQTEMACVYEGCKNTAIFTLATPLETGHLDVAPICKNHLKSIVDYYVRVHGYDGLDAKSILRLGALGITPKQ
jgi:hypothetical protein